MPLVDDSSIALESNIADFNHTADKFKFQKIGEMCEVGHDTSILAAFGSS